MTPCTRSKHRQDGPIKNRQGHNFPKAEMTPQELQRVLPKGVHKVGHAGATCKARVGACVLVALLQQHAL